MPTDTLLHNLMLFGRLLREAGVPVNPGRMVDVVNALDLVDIGNRTDFYYTLRSLLVSRHEDVAIFEIAFNIFWQEPSKGGYDVALKDVVRDRRPPEPIYTTPQGGDEENSAEETEEDDEETQEVIEITRTYSERETFFQKDFGELSAEELEAVQKLMARMTWELGRRKIRRRTPGRGKQIDLRRTVKRGIRNGGEWLSLAKREPKVKPRPIVILADISGSMERYTKLLVHFFYGMSKGLDQRVEVFAFGTRLTRITRQLRNRRIDRALSEVANSVIDWSGGTRIGDSLHTFNHEWGRRVLRGGAIVLLISDGWDRGEPELLNIEMQRLQNTCHRLIWLNPLLGSANYEPLTVGMQAAMPYIDDFLPVHNLASLDELAKYLEQLDDRKGHRQPKTAASSAAFTGR